jgi:hypothetical protein
MDPGVSSSTTQLPSGNWTGDGNRSQDREKPPCRLVDVVEQAMGTAGDPENGHAGGTRSVKEVGLGPVHRDVLGPLTI